MTLVVMVSFYNVIVTLQKSLNSKQKINLERSPTNMDEIKNGAEQEIYLAPETEKIEKCR